jgi:WD40 repeat protein
MVLSAKVLDQNIEDQLKEMQIYDEESREKRCRTELYRFNLADAYSLKDPDFRPIFKNGNPLGPIIDISISVSKNILATVGADKYLRIWEYSIANTSNIITSNLSSDSKETNYSQLSCFFSKEVLNSVSLHPMGFQLAVGTREGVKIFFIIEDGLKIALEIHGKNCYCVRYSNGGHFLAAGNGNLISIIDPYTFQTIFTQIGHLHPVRFLRWTESDSHLLSKSNHGTLNSNFEIYRASDLNSKRVEPDRFEFNVKYMTVNSFVYDEEYDLCCYSTSDCKMTLMNTKHVSKTYLVIGRLNYVNHIDTEFEITSLYLAKNLQVMFAGTSYGSVKVYNWPIMNEINDMDQDPEYAEFYIHAAKVTAFEVTYDKRYLISSAEDGSVFFLKIYRKFC